MESGYYVLIGALIGTLSSALITWINTRSEERKHHREMIVTAAIENWKKNIDSGQFKNVFTPLDNYIIHMSLVSDLIINKKINHSNIDKTLFELKKNAEKLGIWAI